MQFPHITFYITFMKSAMPNDHQYENREHLYSGFITGNGKRLIGPANQIFTDLGAKNLNFRFYHFISFRNNIHSEMLSMISSKVNSFSFFYEGCYPGRR